MNTANATVLLTVGATASDAQQGWDAFLARRSELTSRMELDTCNGCDSCGLRCMDGFTVTQEEHSAVGAYLAGCDPGEVERVLSQQKTVPWPGAEDLDVTVTFCRFRDMDNGNCFVYPARPTVCRLFGHTYWLPCPIGAITSFPEGGAGVWDGYQAFEKRSWSDWNMLRPASVKGEKDETDLVKGVT